MLPNCRHTAILLFVRTAHEEARVKPLISRGGYSGNVHLAKLLNKHARQVAEQTRLPIYTVSGEMQEGATFGERLNNALQLIFDQGFSRVIAIGNDCLELNSQDIIMAATALQERDLVIGPSPDGGAYLIGLSRYLFIQAGFQCLPWESKNLFAELLAWAKKLDACCFFLQEREDADTADTFLRLVHRLAFGTFKIQLLLLLGLFSALRAVLIYTYQSFLTINSPRRGPPLAFSS